MWRTHLGRMPGSLAYPPLTQAFSPPSYSDPAVGERLEPVWFEAPPRRQPQGQAARAGPDRLGQQSKRFEQATK